jgi:hypothetical protein
VCTSCFTTRKKKIFEADTREMSSINTRRLPACLLRHAMSCKSRRLQLRGRATARSRTNLPTAHI